MKKNVGILIFNNVEVLDFAGPFEVFSVASELHNFDLFNVFTISKHKEAISTVNDMSVNPKYDFENHPSIDILIISGGTGTRQIMHDERILAWLESISSKAEYVLSICSGARFLAQLGILNNAPFCTHHEVYDHIIKVDPTAIPVKDKRFIGHNNVYTSGGISAGIDLSFHIVQKIYGEQVALATAKYMEYDWKK
ncbi:DJ-1/PfpI family protein [Aureibacter tunicatorum]|nr:DJ-1/PfpI family protein [Aureibacter tunicatorum]